MIPWSLIVPLALLILHGTVAPAWIEANDAAVETGAGGLQLRDERRVSIRKERLSIGKRFLGPVPSNLPNLQNKYPVIVEYEFENETPEDVTTEVAFPLPEFSYPWEDLIQDRRIRGFKVEVDGTVVPHATAVRAMVGGRDITDLLRGAGIEIESFGRFEYEPRGAGRYQVKRLPEETQAHLKKVGAVDEDLNPRWAAAITYHWKQTFRAGKVVRVRHEYDSIPGFSYDYEVRRYLSELKDGCFDPKVTGKLEEVQARASKPQAKAMISGEWVKYILTTANTWKMPIRTFELIVERPAGQFVGFCWDGKVERLSSTRFRATAHNFVPRRELLVYFLSVGE